jgi:hypothetical protein
MDRRNFLKSLLGVAGAAAAATAFAGRAEALPLLDELQAMDAKGVNPVKIAESEADLPSEGASETQYYYGPPRRRGYYGYRGYRRPVYRRRCRTFVNRRGRVVRQCW